MTFCLYECLKAVGLQRHYARFTSAGVCHAAHLSVLTMEDYPLLGISTMEDRTQLFKLVQMLKSLDLKSLGYEDEDEVVDGDGDDYDYDVDRGEEGYSAVDNVNGNNEEDVSGDKDEKETFARPLCVRRRLDFSHEATSHHQKLLSCPVGSVHVYTNHKRNTNPVQGKGSDSGSPVPCGRKGDNKYKPDVFRCLSERHMREDIKLDMAGGISMYTSDKRLPSRCVSFHKPKPSPATVSSKTFNSNKSFGHKHRKAITRKKNLCIEMDRSGSIGCMAKPTPIYEAKRTDGYNYGLPLSSPSATNKKQVGERRISVCVRKRPLTCAEKRTKETDAVTTPGGECVIVHESKEAVDLTQYILQHRFYFDHVFGEETSNEEVYQRTAYPLVQHMLSGGKATCFAYGQTGAGKTHTMLGSSPGRPGLYALAVQDIFTHISTTHMHSYLQVYVSFFEIYCGQLYDLLDHRKRLFAREDGQKVVHISGLRDIRVDSVSSLLEVISQGNGERTQGMSGVNPFSSRSHTLLQIQLRDPNQEIAGRMWFVDLAGSERASDAKDPDKQSRMEGAEINQSLLALKECIRSLDKEQSHTPFRQSKLTQVLKDSFVGDSMTCMIANISPGHTATDHTLNTLRYADRVKELRGQGGLRGRKGSKTSPKHNLSNSSCGSGISVSTRGKSPPKKPKMGRQCMNFGPTTPTRRLPTGATILCSTPKNSRCGEEANAMGRKEIGLDHITPIRGWLGMSDRKHGSKGTGEKKGRGEMNSSHSLSEQSSRAGLVLEQATDTQLHSWEVQKVGVPRECISYFTKKEPGFSHRSDERKQCTMKGGCREDREWIELRRRVESSTGNTSRAAVRPRQRDFEMADERNKERETHLKRYHQQLQKCMPSSTSSSFHLFSPSTQDSLSSSVSPSSHQHSSSLSGDMQRGLEEALGAFAARVEVRGDDNRGQQLSSSGVTPLKNESSIFFSNNIDDDARGSDGKDSRVSWEETESRSGQDSGEHGRRRSKEATGEARISRREERRPAGMEIGERRWAWVATPETKPANRMAGAIPTTVEAHASHSYDSEDRRDVGVERLDASDISADGVWRTEQEGAVDNYSFVSAHSNNLFSHPPFESRHQQAPAERPLSPACEHTNTFLTPGKLSNIFCESKPPKCNASVLPLPLQNTPEAVPSNSHREKEPWFATNAGSRQFSPATILLHSTPIAQSGCKIPAEPLNKLSENPADTQGAKTSVLPQDETYPDSLSYIMDPLSISLLQVDQQAVTNSFLQGDNGSMSLCPLEYGEENRRGVEQECLTCAEGMEIVVEDEDGEFHLSLLEMPQAKPHCAIMSNPMTATNHTERKICRTGGNKPHTPEVMQRSLQDQEKQLKPQMTTGLGNKDPSSPLKPSTYAGLQTSIPSPSVQPFGTMGSSSLHSEMKNAGQMPPEFALKKLKKPPSSITTPQSESVSGQLNVVSSQCHTVHSNNYSHSNISLQPNNTARLNGQEKPRIHLVTRDELDHAKWCIVEAHWEQLKEMEALCRKEGMLLCQQPDLAFGEYVHKLEEIMERKAWCVHSMRAQLQPYLKPIQSIHTQSTIT